MLRTAELSAHFYPLFSSSIFVSDIKYSHDWNNFQYRCIIGLRGGPVGWRTAIQVKRSQVRFPMVSLEVFIDIILPAALWPWVDSASNRNEYREYFLGGKGCRCLRLTILPPSCLDCLEIWAPTSWNPQSLSTPVMGLLLLYNCIIATVYQFLSVSL
jgi:hypothetical protein